VAAGGTIEVAPRTDSAGVPSVTISYTKPPVRATISSLGQTNYTFAVGPTSTPLSAQTAAAPPEGTVFSFRLDQPATITIAIQRLGRGRQVGQTCRPATRALRHKPPCTRAIAAARLTRAAHFGLNHVAFTGRIRGKALQPSRYEAVFIATDAAGAAAPQSLFFIIAKR
jgi:hypothetical protein